MDPTVNLTPSCSLKGKVIRLELKDIVKDTIGNTVRDVYSFCGVPYAKPPVGDLRFRHPQPIPLWSGVRDATSYGAVCPQDFKFLDLYPFPISRPNLVSEDCLYLNIWTPTLDSNARLPVMFWIHGGAFVSGFSDLYDGEALTNFHDVVFVSINYRVAAFGFLCTGDSSAIGNYGMMDQIEALHFVCKHIAHFGGDPQNITIFGHSAGSMSVSLLTLTPLARGLFRRAICESGTALSAGMVLDPKVAAILLQSALKKVPGGTEALSSGTHLVDFLRHQTTEFIVGLGDRFRPVVNGPFLPDSVRALYTTARQLPCDLMLGCTSHEGLFLLGMLNLTPAILNEPVARLVVRQVCLMLVAKDVVDQVADAAVTEYFGSGELTAEKLMEGLVEFFSDFQFVVDTVAVASYQSHLSKTFLYHFCHQPSFLKSRCPPWVQADHGAEVFLVLGHILKSSGPNPVSVEDIQLCRAIMNYWVNFAKRGDPNGVGLPNWPTYTSSKEHLILKTPKEVGSCLKQHRIDFWTKSIPELMASSHQTAAKY